MCIPQNAENRELSHAERQGSSRDVREILRWDSKAGRSGEIWGNNFFSWQVNVPLLLWLYR